MQEDFIKHCGERPCWREGRTALNGLDATLFISVIFQAEAIFDGCRLRTRYLFLETIERVQVTGGGSLFEGRPGAKGCH
jgi:hypothetical protein